MRTAQAGTTALLEYSAGTSKGSRRELNEDTFGIFEEVNTFIVVDGCGSATSGENAAGLIVDSFAQAINDPLAPQSGPTEADPIALAVVRANVDVFKEIQTNPELQGQGATLCALRAVQKWISVVHVGDCRIGLSRKGSLTWLTVDHSLVAEMQKSGAPRAEIERLGKTHSTVITRAVGVREDLAVDLSYHPTFPGDLLLLCSDGLTRHVDQAQIAGVLTRVNQSLSDRCAALLDLAETAGGHDNATVILIQIGE
jgi:PPM family protein phosphatase